MTRTKLFRILVGGVCLAAVGVAAGLAAWNLERRPELSPVASGKILAESAGCFACHGRHEDDPRANFRSNASGAWRPKGNPTLWENGIDEAEVLTAWIRDGFEPGEEESHRRFHSQMPAYGEALSAEEIDAIVAWILAEGLRYTEGMGNAGAPLPELTAASVAALPPEQLFALGDRASRRLGCYQCHGELGQGGVENPLSFKGFIPGFFGGEFLDLTDGGDRAEIGHWIDHGRGDAIERGALGRVAKRFFEGQAIDMPAYADLTNEGEKALLVEFMLLLNARGPLSGKDLEGISRQLAEATNR